MDGWGYTRIYTRNFLLNGRTKVNRKQTNKGSILPPVPFNTQLYEMVGVDAAIRSCIPKCKRRTSETEKNEYKSNKYRDQFREECVFSELEI